MITLLKLQCKEYLLAMNKSNLNFLYFTLLILINIILYVTLHKGHFLAYEYLIIYSCLIISMSIKSSVKSNSFFMSVPISNNLAIKLRYCFTWLLTVLVVIIISLVMLFMNSLLTFEYNIGEFILKYILMIILFTSLGLFFSFATSIELLILVFIILSGCILFGLFIFEVPIKILLIPSMVSMPISYLLSFKVIKLSFRIQDYFTEFKKKRA